MKPLHLALPALLAPLLVSGLASGQAELRDPFALVPGTDGPAPFNRPDNVDIAHLPRRATKTHCVVWMTQHPSGLTEHRATIFREGIPDAEPYLLGLSSPDAAPPAVTHVSPNFTGEGAAFVIAHGERTAAVDRIRVTAIRVFDSGPDQVESLVVPTHGDATTLDIGGSDRELACVTWADTDHVHAQIVRVRFGEDLALQGEEHSLGGWAEFDGDEAAGAPYFRPRITDQSGLSWPHWLLCWEGRWESGQPLVQARLIEQSGSLGSLLSLNSRTMSAPVCAGDRDDFCVVMQDHEVSPAVRALRGWRLTADAGHLLEVFPEPQLLHEATELYPYMPEVISSRVFYPDERPSIPTYTVAWIEKPYAHADGSLAVQTFDGELLRPVAPAAYFTDECRSIGFSVWSPGGASFSWEDFVLAFASPAGKFAARGVVQDW